MPRLGRLHVVSRLKMFRKKKKETEYVSDIVDRVKYSVMDTVYYVFTNRRTYRDRRYRYGFICREYSGKRGYMSIVVSHKYLCTKHYEPDLVYWLSACARCYEEYSKYKGIGFYGVLNIQDRITVEKYREMEKRFKEKFPVLYGMLTIWANNTREQVQENNEEFEGGVVDDSYKGVEEGVIICPTKGFLYIMVRGGKAYVVFSGIREEKRGRG